MGSVRAITDAGRTAVVFDYAPFGDGGVGGGASPAALRFAAKERDPETGLDYFGARYYGSRTGRFTTVDPVVPLDAALRDELVYIKQCFTTSDVGEAIAAFREKRQPVFRGA